MAHWHGHSEEGPVNSSYERYDREQAEEAAAIAQQVKDDGPYDHEGDP